MRQKKEELPVVLEAPGVKMRSLGGQGGMARFRSQRIFDRCSRAYRMTNAKFRIGDTSSKAK